MFAVQKITGYQSLKGNPVVLVEELFVE